MTSIIKLLLVAVITTMVSHTHLHGEDEDIPSDESPIGGNIEIPEIDLPESDLPEAGPPEDEEDSSDESLDEPLISKPSPLEMSLEQLNQQQDAARAIFNKHLFQKHGYHIRIQASLHAIGESDLAQEMPPNDLQLFGAITSEIKTHGSQYGIQTEQERIQLAHIVQGLVQSYKMGYRDAAILTMKTHPDRATLRANTIEKARDIIENRSDNKPPVPVMQQKKYFTHDGETKSGPFSLKEIMAMKRNNELQLTDFIWHGGIKDWISVEEYFKAEE